jgi:bifunctional DNA-binding transcriptional regulator/antitoxin component of YhaV-PrlF toxin-antitoxin module
VTKTTPPKPPKTEFRAKVTGRHAITLPAELCRRLQIETGDTVELALVGGQALLRKAPEDEPVPELVGLLSDYFADWEDVKRFIEEERSGGEERDRLLYGDDFARELAERAREGSGSEEPDPA